MWNVPWVQRALLLSPHSQLFLADFTTLAAGAASTLFGLSHTRGSGATVQTGTSTLVTGLGTDVAGIGRALDADPLGLVIEESRQNANTGSNAFTSFQTGVTHVENSADFTDPAGGTASQKIVYDGAGSVAATYRAFLTAIGVGTAGIGYCASGFVRGGAAVPLRYYNNTTISTFTNAALWTRRSALTASWPDTRGVQAAIYAGVVDNSAFTAYAYGMQVEVGKFVTELIPTSGVALTRSGARLWHPTLAAVTASGRLELRLLLQAKGATTDYASAPYLFKIDASNYATISNVDGKVTIVVNGSSYTTASGVTWAKDDALDIRIMAGGGALNSMVMVGKNGGALSTLGTSGAPQAALPASGTLDLLQDGSAANVLSARLRSVSAYAPGALLVVP